MRELSVGPETFVKHLFRVGFSDEARLFEFLQHFVGCIIIKCNYNNN